MFRRNWVVAIGFAAAAFLSGSVTFSAVPSRMNYNGILTDGSGVPQVGTFTVTFAIYDVPAGGAALWTEPQSVTTDAEGRFTVMLGSINSLNDGVFSGTDRYLGTAVSPDGEMVPRTRIVTVAYAFRAATVDGTSGGTVTGTLTLTAGNVELDHSTSTTGNIRKDGTTFIHNFGFENTFIGTSAGNLTMTGEGNTAAGSFALNNITSGVQNTALGLFALYRNTGGGGNTAAGMNALYNNTSGSSNTASGVNALLNNTTGGNNTAIGVSTLFRNTSGFVNTASGINALFNNTSGFLNTASGGSALGGNTTGNQNSANGASALLLNTVGNNNSALGYQALMTNDSGLDNTACGVHALLLNTTGDANSAVGTDALRNNSTGSWNVALGPGALSVNTSGDNNTALGNEADVSAANLTNATAIGNGAIVDASNKIRLGNSAVTVIEGQVAYTFTSDKNAKENFREVNGNEVLQKLRDLDVQSWNYKGHDPEHFRHYGPVAQDFYAAFGKDDVGTVGTPTTINSGDMAGILMIAVQALEKRTAENDELKARIEALEKLVLAK